MCLVVTAVCYLLFCGVVSSKKMECYLDTVSSMENFNFSLFSGIWEIAQNVSLGLNDFQDAVKLRFDFSGTYDKNNITVSNLTLMTPSASIEYKFYVESGQGDITVQTDLAPVKLKVIDADYETYSVVSLGKSALWVLARDKEHMTFTKNNLSKVLGDSCVDIVDRMYTSPKHIQDIMVKKQRRFQAVRVLLAVSGTVAVLFIGIVCVGLLKRWKSGYVSV